MNVYRVNIEQWTEYAGESALHNESTRSVRARSAQEAIRRVVGEARRDGYLKSRPIDVVKVERIAADVL